MKLGVRIFLSYLIVFGIGFYYLIHWVLGDLRSHYLEGVEEVLVDQSNILAAFAGKQISEGRFDPEQWHLVFDEAVQRPLRARIYDLTKSSVDMGAYLTDSEGRVLFHARNRGMEGRDFSTWRDVHLTLSGEYGARSTREDPDDPLSAAMHVSAPVFRGDQMAGVLTLIKPTTSISRFMQFAKIEVIKVGVLSAAAVMVASFLTIFWFTRPIKRLTRYANEITAGGQPSFPRLDRSEIGEMGAAFDKMQKAIEGRKYVESYVQAFTHEIKSPLSAIRGAAELLEEEMPEAQRTRFIKNIRSETQRIHKIVQRLLRLASLEKQTHLQTVETFYFDPLLDSVQKSMNAILTRKKIRMAAPESKKNLITGDRFLIRQAVSNLILNAVEFSPENSRIFLSVQESRDRLVFIIEDEGPGIPEFAKERIFQKFFSLQRPDTGKKSTGLGLNFVKEVAKLHGGRVTLENRQPHGTRAELTLFRTLKPQ